MSNKLLWWKKLDETYYVSVDCLGNFSLKKDDFEVLQDVVKIPTVEFSFHSDAAYAWENKAFEYIDSKSKSNDKSVLIKKIQKKEPAFKEVMIKTAKQKKKERKQGFDKYGKAGQSNPYRKKD